MIGFLPPNAHLGHRPLGLNWERQYALQEPRAIDPRDAMCAANFLIPAR